mmetsp:Transcript_26298/g.72593  ORF Transcript_26298/g.72593 Transcript_26298/m.72593 type:complete len:583 (+) Transcript_26298:66-1814(+)
MKTTLAVVFACFQPNKFFAQSFAVKNSRLLLPLATVLGSTWANSGSSASCTTSSTSLAMGNSASVATSDAKTLEEASEAYKTLKTKLTTITQLERVNGLLEYDQMVFMPESAAGERGAQMSALAAVVHDKSTDKEILKLIEQSEQDLATNSDGTHEFKEEARLLELEKKDFLNNARVSSELASRQAALKAESHGVWAKARQDNDFSAFEPLLKKCFDTSKEIAEAKRGGKTGISHYTQMLDEFEMGMSPQRIDDIFDEIQKALVPLIEKVLSDKATPPSTEPLNGDFPIDQQKEMNRKLVTALGFDEDKGRIDVSVHPFTLSISPSDVRITSRFRTDEWYQGLAGTIHEGGHALYEQNLGSSALKLDSALSMGMHESQSLFWERHVGLSKPFWSFATPILKEHLPELEKYSSDELYGAVNAVSRSLIRVEADELTYPLHVILRYLIERDVIEGKLAVKDIPAQWNKLMKEMLGVSVPNDTKGCLQDVHWSMMAIGYFPTYLIGSSTAAQLAHYCKKDIPDFDKRVSAGDFKEIKAWLTKKVHVHGKRYKSLDDLLESELGEPLNPQYFITYLTEKYSELYKI